MKKLLIVLTLLSFLGSVSAVNLDKVKTGAKPGTVALTFDDGPSPVYTPQVLKILTKNHIHATFFVLGATARHYPKLVKAILDQGSVIANHSMTHPKLTKISAKKLKYEVVDSRDAIKKVAGYAPLCLRPPFGLGNKKVGAYIRKQGMIMVPMGFNSFDYERRGTEKLVDWVVSNARSGRTFLLHDGGKARGQTVAALPKIIAGIRKKGLGFSVICSPKGLS